MQCRATLPYVAEYLPAGLVSSFHFGRCIMHWGQTHVATPPKLLIGMLDTAGSFWCAAVHWFPRGSLLCGGRHRNVIDFRQRVCACGKHPFGPYLPSSHPGARCTGPGLQIQKDEMCLLVLSLSNFGLHGKRWSVANVRITLTECLCEFGRFEQVRNSKVLQKSSVLQTLGPRKRLLATQPGLT
jgi:hypothetical protein